MAYLERYRLHPASPDGGKRAAHSPVRRQGFAAELRLQRKLVVLFTRQLITCNMQHEGVGMTESLTSGSGVTRGDALVDQAFRLLRDQILNHELLPGTKLSVPEVARRLDISRSPAREAITRIAFEGLADVVPHKGAIVASIGAEDLIHIYQLREVLEGLAGRIAAEHIDKAGLAELESILEAHTAAVRAGDVETHMELDARFHRVIRESSDNSRLIDSLNRLQGQIRLAMATTHLLGGGMEKALSEHRSIIDSLRKGDPRDAETVSRNHIERLRINLELAAKSESKRMELLDG